ncbi:viroplasmin family protein [Globicatella sp. PHS-GS-PNBC-21-1553]|uniref:ribonuclease H1 domain-containing protein n=1 Tax=Globicatella sp. PHS-GS-PNBC-21-1553 TaxID=2885764 RepID=UPI00298F11CE|nr:viroplasmin family protein [Globicatella sp. PHS-GS-PNBC-21-1553]WPC08793.1 viroplasmin family protein [Globicatella sp. PHS-GS-PNBC-21-1553]
MGNGEKWYAVKIGRVPGIYNQWNEAEKQIKGFKGAIFKSFTKVEEAEKFMDKEVQIDNHTLSSSEINERLNEELKNIEERKAIAFVDGSYTNKPKEKYSYGVIIFYLENGEVAKKSFYKAFVGKEFMQSKNVSGEIEGVIESISWALENGIKDIKIYYDYSGIEKWAKGEWKAESLIAKKYTGFLSQVKAEIEIKFEHLSAHSGIKFNEEADRLAKNALVENNYKTYRDGSVYVSGLTKADLDQVIEEFKNEALEFDEENVIEVSSNIVKDGKEKYQINDFNKNRISINFYGNSKLYIQGKTDTSFYQRFITLAINKLPSNEAVITVLNKLNDTERVDDLEKQFKELLPNVIEQGLDMKMKNNLLTAIFNYGFEANVPDYTFLVTPIFRAFDYYLHLILNGTCGLDTSKGFGFFNKDHDSNEYHFNVTDNPLNSFQLEYLNKLYNTYKQVRDPFSHWALNPLDVRVIPDIQTSKDFLFEGLQLVDEYYKVF